MVGSSGSTEGKGAKGKRPRREEKGGRTPLFRTISKGRISACGEKQARHLQIVRPVERGALLSKAASQGSRPVEVLDHVRHGGGRFMTGI